MWKRTGMKTWSKPVGRREKRNACAEPVLKMRRAQGREEVARDQV